MCYETSLRFDISLREIFLQLGSIRVMEKYDESVLMQILQVFGKRCQKVFQNVVL